MTGSGIDDARDLLLVVEGWWWIGSGGWAGFYLFILGNRIRKT